MTSKEDLPEEFLKKLHSVTGKRAKIVIDHILEHGYITTEDLEKTYGYSHPPRAARDVREQGIPLETFKVKSSDGRNIAAYRFGSLEDVHRGRLGGSALIPKRELDIIPICGSSHVKLSESFGKNTQMPNSHSEPGSQMSSKLPGRHQPMSKILIAAPVSSSTIG